MKKCFVVTAWMASVLVFGACSQEPAKKQAPLPKVAPATGQTTLSFRVEDLSAQALEILNLRCTVCHESKRFDKRAFTEAEWNAVIEKMQEKGAMLSGDEMDVLRHGRKVE